MPVTMDEVYSQALTLPDDSKETLAERLVAYLEAHLDPILEQEQVAEAKRRRDEVRAGQVVPLDGEMVLAKARQVVAR